jgi:hypothetical protein
MRSMNWNDSEASSATSLRWEFWAHVGEVMGRQLTRAELDAAAADRDIVAVAARLFPRTSAEERSEILWAAGRFVRADEIVEAMCA